MGVMLDLPNEVLIGIFELFQIQETDYQGDLEVPLGKETIGSLMRTNCRLNLLATPMFMRQLKVDIATRDKEKGSFRMSLFLKCARIVDSSS